MAKLKQGIFYILLSALFLNMINLSTFTVMAKENTDTENNIEVIVDTLPKSEEITYGQYLGESALTGGVVKYGDTIVNGSFSWKYPDIRPIAKDSNSTEYTIIFTPSDEDNYKEINCLLKLTINKAKYPENLPNKKMSVSSDTKKVNNIKLPNNWKWEETDNNKELKFGKIVTAKAIYVGDDKENYEITEIDIDITRKNCKHENTELRHYIENKYTGDEYCKDCGTKISTGHEIVENNYHDVSENNNISINSQVTSNNEQKLDIEDNDEDLDLENIEKTEDSHEKIKEDIKGNNNNKKVSPVIAIAMAFAVGRGLYFFLTGKM